MDPTAQMWNSVASAWERHADAVDEQTAPATALMLERAGVAPGASVVDLAAGPGGAGVAAAAVVGAEGEVVISDVAPAMVEAAARRTAGLPQVRTALLDLAAIDLPDASFDAALCRHGLMFAADKPAAVREVARVLRPGGRFATATWGPRERNPWLGIALDAVGAEFGVPFPPPGAPTPFALDDPDALAAILAEGGLEGARTDVIETPLRADSVEDWWAVVLELAGPLAQAMAGMEPAVQQSIRERAIASAESAVEPADDGGVSLPGQILVASGRRPG